MKYDPEHDRFEFHLEFELEQEIDGRWICDCITYNGCFVYGNTQAEAYRNCLELVAAVGPDLWIGVTFPTKDPDPT